LKLWNELFLIEWSGGSVFLVDLNVDLITSGLTFYFKLYLRLSFVSSFKFSLNFGFVVLYITAIYQLIIGLY